MRPTTRLWHLARRRLARTERPPRAYRPINPPDRFAALTAVMRPRPPC